MSACLKTHTWMRTQQLHTIIFLSHYEAVKGAVAPVQRGRTTVCSVTPIWFPFSFFYPHNIDFDLFQCPMHFNLKKWTWAASSAILRVAVISQRSLLHPASFCCSNFPNGLILNYEFPKIYYTYITLPGRRNHTARLFLPILPRNPRDKPNQTN